MIAVRPWPPHGIRKADFGENAIAAGRDTFHFTNCAPQGWTFNEHKVWRQIEVWTAMQGNDRLCLFKGPVFDGPTSERRADGEYNLRPHGDRVADPNIDGVSVPKSFFKIAVYLVDGVVKVQSFLVTQEAFLDPYIEAAITPQQLRLYRVPLGDVSVLTGLDFSEIAAIADSINEAASFEPELITSRNQI